LHIHGTKIGALYPSFFPHKTQGFIVVLLIACRTIFENPRGLFVPSSIMIEKILSKEFQNFGIFV